MYCITDFKANCINTIQYSPLNETLDLIMKSHCLLDMDYEKQLDLLIDIIMGHNNDNKCQESIQNINFDGNLIIDCNSDNQRFLLSLIDDHQYNLNDTEVSVDSKCHLCDSFETSKKYYTQSINYSTKRKRKYTRKKFIKPKYVIDYLTEAKTKTCNVNQIPAQSVTDCISSGLEFLDNFFPSLEELEKCELFFDPTDSISDARQISNTNSENNTLVKSLQEIVNINDDVFHV